MQAEHPKTVPFLRIKDWEIHFENNRTRDLKKMAWVPIPNKMDGDGYTELMDHPDGPSHFAAWIAIVEIASRCTFSGIPQESAGIPHEGAGIPHGPAHDPQKPASTPRSGACAPSETRGRLIRASGIPHDISSLSRLSRIPKNVFAAAIPRLLMIGWMEHISFEVNQLQNVNHNGAGIPQEGAGIPQEGAGIPQEGVFLTRVRGTERNGTEVLKNPPYPPNPASGPGVPEKPARRKHPEVSGHGDENLQSVVNAFDRHLKHSNREPKDLVIQQVLSMNGKLDWKRFKKHHPGYCEHYETHGWDFCILTFLGWINAGMPPAPPQATAGGRSGGDSGSVRSNLPSVNELRERDRKREKELNGQN